MSPGEGGVMSPFELVFALFGLLLGLAIAEVLGGFSHALKLKRGAKPVRIGWLTPLLGLFVITDLTSFWLNAYLARDQLSANYLTLLVVLAMVGIYYLAASMIFPDDPEAWPDFDAWYDRQNRLVLGGMLTANIGALIGQVALEITRPVAVLPSGSELASRVQALMGLATFALLIALLVVRGRRVNVTLLATLLLLLLAAAIAEVAL
jgi:hypothetical protein